MSDTRIQIADEAQLEAVYGLRWEVFVTEQGVAPEIERDEEDAHALHVLATQDGCAVGCARVLLSPEGAHVGRLAVKRTHRGQGIGRAVMQFIISDCHARGYTTVWLNAQCHAIDFYRACGFETEGETFMEAGIPHVRMSIQ